MWIKKGNFFQKEFLAHKFLFDIFKKWFVCKSWKTIFFGAKSKENLEKCESINQMSSVECWHARLKCTEKKVNQKLFTTSHLFAGTLFNSAESAVSQSLTISIKYTQMMYIGLVTQYRWILIKFISRKCQMLMQFD